MSISKHYRWGGLNLRSSDLVVDKSQSTDLKNVELNYAGELVKRSGYQVDVTMPSGEIIIDLIHYKESNSLVAMADDGLYIKNGPVFNKAPLGLATDSVTWNGKVSDVEINGAVNAVINSR